MREHRDLDAYPLYVEWMDGIARAYIATSQGPYYAYGACPRIVFNEFYPGAAIMSYGTKEYDPFDYPGVAYPHYDQDLLPNLESVTERLHVGSHGVRARSIVLDFPEDPANTPVCNARVLNEPDAMAPGRCGLLSFVAADTPVNTPPYAGWTCRAVAP